MEVGAGQDGIRRRAGGARGKLPAASSKRGGQPKGGQKADKKAKPPQANAAEVPFSPEELVRRPVNVWWWVDDNHTSGEFFKGTVTRYLQESGEHEIDYPDEENLEVTNLLEENVHWNVDVVEDPWGPGAILTSTNARWRAAAAEAPSAAPVAAGDRARSDSEAAQVAPGGRGRGRGRGGGRGGGAQPKRQSSVRGRGKRGSEAAAPGDGEPAAVPDLAAPTAVDVAAVGGDAGGEVEAAPAAAQAESPPPVAAAPPAPDAAAGQQQPEAPEQQQQLEASEQQQQLEASEQQQQVQQQPVPRPRAASMTARITVKQWVHSSVLGGTQEPAAGSGADAGAVPTGAAPAPEAAAFDAAQGHAFEPTAQAAGAAAEPQPGPALPAAPGAGALDVDAAAAAAEQQAAALSAEEEPAAPAAGQPPPFNTALAEEVRPPSEAAAAPAAAQPPAIDVAMAEEMPAPAEEKPALPEPAEAPAAPRPPAAAAAPAEEKPAPPEPAEAPAAKEAPGAGSEQKRRPNKRGRQRSQQGGGAEAAANLSAEEGPPDASPGGTALAHKRRRESRPGDAKPIVAGAGPRAKPAVPAGGAEEAAAAAAAGLASPGASRKAEAASDPLVAELEAKRVALLQLRQEYERAAEIGERMAGLLRELREMPVTPDHLRQLNTLHPAEKSQQLPILVRTLGLESTGGGKSCWADNHRNRVLNSHRAMHSAAHSVLQHWMAMNKAGPAGSAAAAAAAAAPAAGRRPQQRVGAGQQRPSGARPAPAAATSVFDEVKALQSQQPPLQQAAPPQQQQQAQQPLQQRKTESTELPASAATQQRAQAAAAPEPQPFLAFQSTGNWHRDAAIQVLLLALNPAATPLGAALELEQQLWEDHKGQGGAVSVAYMRAVRAAFNHLAPESEAHRPLLRYCVLTGQVRAQDVARLTAEDVRAAEARALQELQQTPKGPLQAALDALPPLKAEESPVAALAMPSIPARDPVAAAREAAALLNAQHAAAQAQAAAAVAAPAETAGEVEMDVDP